METSSKISSIIDKKKDLPERKLGENKRKIDLSLDTSDLMSVMKFNGLHQATIWCTCVSMYIYLSLTC